MATLTLPLEKLAFIVIKAHELDAQVEPVNPAIRQTRRMIPSGKCSRTGTIRSIRSSTTRSRG